MALEDQGVPHARCVILIEACEESGSYDLPFYVDHLADSDRRSLARGLPRLAAAETTTSSGSLHPCVG